MQMTKQVLKLELKDIRKEVLSELLKNTENKRNRRAKISTVFFLNNLI